MARVAWKALALAVASARALGAQAVVNGAQMAPCEPGVRWTEAGSATAAAAAVTALQKSTARRSGGFSMSVPVSASTEWNDAQTPLHIIASYQLARVGSRAFGGCASRAAAIWRGAAYSAAIGVGKEVVDGFYDGFNPSDLVADGAGIALAVAHGYAPRLEAIQFTVSLSGLGASRTPRGTRLGAPGHATWLSASPDRLLPARLARHWPAAARLSAGRRISQAATTAPEYVFTLDLDASRLLPAGNGSVRTLLRGIHLPAPGVIMAQGQRARFGLVW